jgi:hypothetical protein
LQAWMTPGSARATRSQMSRSSNVRMGMTSSMVLVAMMLFCDRLTRISLTWQEPFRRTMTKARRSGRGPLASRQATYSDLMGSWGLWSVGVLGSVYFCESVYLQCYDVELQRSVLVVGLNNLSDLDNLLDRKLVCQSLLVIATKFFDTM